MREILFRGKMKYHNAWRYGHLAHINGSNFIIDSGATMGYDGMDEYEEIERKTVGQYTGLKDKNGKPIFEGDILRITDHDVSVNGIWQVVFCTTNHCWALQRNVGFHHSYFTFSNLNGFNESSTIIGNAYDYPELMGVR